MQKEKNNKQTFVAGVLTIMGAQVVIKLLGFFYRQVLINIPEFGDEGSGIYGIGFNFYMLLLTITTIGIPGAISKLISDKYARGSIKDANNIFRIALVLFSVIGILGTIVMLSIANTMAKLAGNESATRCINCTCSFNIICCYIISI